MSLYLLWMSYLRSIFVFSFVIVILVLPVQSIAEGQVVINEFLPHPSSGNKEWVEIYVPEGIDISNYWIDDDTDFTNDTGSSSKKQITSIIQGADNKHLVFALPSSMFNNSGDTIALFTPEGSLVDSYTYTDDPGSDISIGRTPDGMGDFHVLAYATRGSVNTIPMPSDTPTPQPTDKPPKEPKPTSTPKPEKTMQNTKIDTGENDLSDAISTAHITTRSLATKKVSSTSAHPTSVLSSSSRSAERKISRVPTIPVMVKGVSTQIPQVIAVCGGGVLLLAYGILIYLKKKGKINF